MSNKAEDKHPVVQVAAKVGTTNKDEPVTLSSGYLAYIRPVSASLIDQVTAKVKDPQVPTWHNPDKDRDEPNPGDPAYLEALDEASRKRGLVAMDAIIMFGVELVDPIPTDSPWIKKLAYLGIEVDTEDPFELEFLFKKYVAVSADDVSLVTARSGMTSEDVAEAERNFRGKGS